MALRRIAGGLTLTLALILGMANDVTAQAAPGSDEEAARAALREWMGASPEYAKIQYDLVKAHAGLAVRIERLVMIGARCKLLTEEDSQLIVANGRAEMEFGQSVLFEDQKADFAVYLEGLRYGAFVAADPGLPEPAECEDFAKPGGTLVKLLTWTGRRQLSAPASSPAPEPSPDDVGRAGEDRRGRADRPMRRQRLTGPQRRCWVSRQHWSTLAKI